MAISTLVKVIGAAAIALGGKAWYDMKKKEERRKKKGVPVDYLAHYFAPGATLGASTQVVGEIENVVTLTNIVMRDRDGNMHNVESATFNPPTAEDPEGVWASTPQLPEGAFSGMGSVIGRVVSNLSGSGATTIDSAIVDEYINGPLDPSDPDAPAAVAIAAMNKLRPNIAWETTVEGSAEEMVLIGAFIIAQITQQNLPEG